MRPKRLEPKSGCAAELTMSVIGGLWKPTILVNLLMGKKRFMELCRLIPDATHRVLTLQLRELEADGLVTRRVFAEVPPRVEYEATELARSVAPILASLRDWGNAFRDNQQRLPELEPYCPAEELEAATASAAS
ncbi:helix-turn-helix transcriptional regulator (plasmid) [Rhizobium bangladeshense]|uniref:Transcriptional regulator, HxlR family n=2 Tax=Rhizobium TaxID=379 RepID=A0A1C3Y3Y3_9HYPH|nr:MULTISPECIES: helix-turn-helix domain-containing protein [Rhizobium]MBX4894611.1 helix-turn-helix transcriptional regulator [Rhizobium bangladeshense]MBX4903504.1 helix-turn-helix transcriptional regulator [Rhizobium bangladeshense]MBX4914805.1 helix-turn-helix transcriptional regulator [Rhizobium bangladeshense]MBX4934790.1 helix-turn-helix transcriptional regulator [Rhizobium bangladeshense]MBY3580470.1 helix-turn-helix transcriptional regulator [Rhizobium bangladeshense]